MFHECFVKGWAKLTTPSAQSAVASQHFNNGGSTPPFQGRESALAILPLPISLLQSTRAYKEFRRIDTLSE
jgi:hypothetical protein